MDSWKDWFLLVCVIGLIVGGFYVYNLNERVTELETYHDVIENTIDSLTSGVHTTVNGTHYSIGE